MDVLELLRAQLARRAFCALKTMPAIVESTRFSFWGAGVAIAAVHWWV